MSSLGILPIVFKIFVLNYFAGCTEHPTNFTVNTDLNATINASEDFRRYGRHDVISCQNPTEAFKCIAKCLDHNFDIARADRQCRCRCFMDSDKITLVPKLKPKLTTIGTRADNPPTYKTFNFKKKKGEEELVAPNIKTATCTTKTNIIVMLESEPGTGKTIKINVVDTSDPSSVIFEGNNYELTDKTLTIPKSGGPGDPVTLKAGKTFKVSITVTNNKQITSDAKTKDITCPSEQELVAPEIVTASCKAGEKITVMLKTEPGPGEIIKINVVDTSDPSSVIFEGNNYELTDKTLTIPNSGGGPGDPVTLKAGKTFKVSITVTNNQQITSDAKTKDITCPSEQELVAPEIVTASCKAGEKITVMLKTEPGPGEIIKINVVDTSDPSSVIFEGNNYELTDKTLTIPNSGGGPGDPVTLKAGKTFKVSITVTNNQQITSDAKTKDITCPSEQELVAPEIVTASCKAGEKITVMLKTEPGPGEIIKINVVDTSDPSSVIFEGNNYELTDKTLTIPNSGGGPGDPVTLKAGKTFKVSITVTNNQQITSDAKTKDITCPSEQELVAPEIVTASCKAGEKITVMLKTEPGPGEIIKINVVDTSDPSSVIFEGNNYELTDKTLTIPNSGGGPGDPVTLKAGKTFKVSITVTNNQQITSDAKTKDITCPSEQELVAPEIVTASCKAGEKITVMLKTEPGPGEIIKINVVDTSDPSSVIFEGNNYELTDKTLTIPNSGGGPGDPVTLKAGKTFEVSITVTKGMKTSDPVKKDTDACSAA